MEWSDLTGNIKLWPGDVNLQSTANLVYSRCVLGKLLNVSLNGKWELDIIPPPPFQVSVFRRKICLVSKIRMRIKYFLHHIM